MATSTIGGTVGRSTWLGSEPAGLGSSDLIVARRPAGDLVKAAISPGRARHDNGMINLVLESPLRGEAAGIGPVTTSSADVRAYVSTVDGRGMGGGA
jgi:hypothetical protein